jgi:hypothetical protein
MSSLTPVQQLQLRPFAPLRSIKPIPHPARGWKKRYRLHMFPFVTRFKQLSASQCARLRIMRKPCVQRLRQLKHCARLLEQSRNMSRNLDQLQSTFINIAQQVHHIRTSVEYNTIGPPPFDGYSYVWTWKSIIIRFCGSNTYFSILFDFSRYISPACAEYGLVVY